jgi:tripartite-type tricarboxylate transporter receptor subunit TctC
MPNLACFRRRIFLQGTAALTVVSALPRLAHADGFPSQTINFIVPDSGGGSFDAYVHKFSQLVEPYLKPSVNVEPLTLPGAGGQAAVFNLLHDQPDGYNIGMINVPGLFTAQYDKKRKPLDLSQLTWVANLGRESYGVAVSAKSSIRNIADLKALSQSRKISFSSTGFGSTDYFATRVFNAALGLNFRQVLGYTGSSPTMIAVARGDVDAVVHSLATLEAMQGSGLIRIIFVFQDKSPLPGIDDATSIGHPELGDIYQWRPVAAPPGVPLPIVNTLSDALVAAASTPDAAAWAKTAGTTLYPLNHVATLNMVKTQMALVDKWKFALT